MKSPFKFLDSYTKYDREIFFGRDREIEELYHRVFESKLMLVYGVSGTGKSSLIHCGLANKFQETDWLPLVVRRGGNIINSMAGAIQASAITKQEGQLSSPIQFKKAVRSLYLDHYKPVYFIFDQFEELFIFGDKEERKSFVNIIKSLVESDLQCRFIFILREEYMANITEFERHIPTIFANRVRIEKMAHLNAIEAIKGPCKASNINLEEGFAETLLEKLSPGMAEVELTYLQVFLDKIFRLAKGDKGAEKEQELLSFTLPLLHKVGNVTDLLGSFLDEQIALLSNPDTALAVLKSFVSVRGTKRPMTSGDVKEYAQTLGKPVEESVLLEMLQTFIHLRILRDKDQDERYELRHDALAAKIYEKITLVEKEILEIRQFIENAWNNWQKRKVVLSEDDLNYIAPYESKLYLPKDHSELVENSKKELTKARRRRRNLISVAAFLLIIVLSGFTFWALKERNKSIIKERQARANNFNYLSKEISVHDPTVGLQIAQFAHEMDPGNSSILENLTRIYYDNSFYHKSIICHSVIWSAAFSPDGKTILVGLGDRTAKLLDREGNTLQIFGDYENEIKAVAFSPDGKTIVTGNRNGSLKRWNLQGSSTEIFKIDPENGITSVAFSPDGKLIVIALGENAILMDFNGNVKHIFKGHSDYIRSVKFSPDGLKILTGSADGTARLWNIDGKILKILKGHLGGINSVAFSPDGKAFLTGSTDLTAKLWDLNGNPLKTFSGHSDVIWSVEFSPDGKTILTGSGDHTARLFDLQGSTLQILRGHVGEMSAFFSPDGKIILTAASDKYVKLWNVQSNTLQILNGHKYPVRSVAFSSDGKTILTGSIDVRLWDQNGNTLEAFKDTTWVLSSALSPDGLYIATSSNYSVARLWDRHGKPLATLNAHKSFIYMVAFSPDGKNILTGSYDNTARLWDLQGNTLQILSGHTFSVTSVAFSPDGKYLLTGSRDNTARLWDLNGKQLQIFRGHRDAIWSVSFSPDGKTVLTGSGDNTARLWDVNGNLLQVFKGHNDRINSVAFSKNGKYILTGSRDKTARLWKLNGENLQIFDENRSYVHSVVFSPDDRSVLIGYADGTARMYAVKMPLEDFQRKQSIQILTTAQKLAYGIIEKNEFLRSNNLKQLNEAIDYYISEARMQPDLNKNSSVVTNISDLIKKAHSVSKKVDENISFLLYCTYLYRIKPEKHLLNYIKDTNSKLLSLQQQTDILTAFNLYIQYCDNPDSLEVIFEYPEAMISISRKLLENVSTDLITKRRIAVSCSNLSYGLFQFKKFKTSLDAVSLAVKADSTNEIEYTNLALAYLFNNQYDKAERIYRDWKERPWKSDENFKTYREAFQSDIEDMESKGIYHTDFAKVKELLKK
jgi:WD40 repeat protein